MEPAEPFVFVSEKVAGVDTPGTVAFTVYGPPAVALELTLTEARPEPLVTAVTVEAMPAPLPGPAKLTVKPGSGLLLPSFTKATNGLLNAVLMAAVWPLPADAVMDAGTAAEILRFNVAFAVCGELLESRTVKTALLEPGAVGVPVMTPAGLMDKPAGRPMAVQLYGATPPAADMVNEYGMPTPPLGSEDVVTFTGPVTVRFMTTSAMFTPLA